MRRLPQTNFDETLSLIYENMHTGKQKVIKEWAPIVGALARGAVAGLASGAVSNMMDDEDAEDVGGGSMRGYMEDELVSAFEGDGVMDLEEFIGLGEKYLSALHGGPRIDAGDMDLEEFVSMVGEKIGMDLQIRGNKVMLADYRD